MHCIRLPLRSKIPFYYCRCFTVQSFIQSSICCNYLFCDFLCMVFEPEFVIDKSFFIWFGLGACTARRSEHRHEFACKVAVYTVQQVLWMVERLSHESQVSGTPPISSFERCIYKNKHMMCGWKHWQLYRLNFEIRNLLFNQFWD